MATKSYSKHKEFKEFSTKSTVPYNSSSDEQFDMIRAELLPKNSKLNSLPRNGADSEYYYEYKEDKHPSGKYERKNLHTVEHYTVPSKPNTEHSSYYYNREDATLPAITSSSHYENTTSSTTPGYSRIKSKATKELSHNVDELDSLLDDLQRDQERQLYKSGYTSDTADSSSFDYRKTSTPVKTSTPSSGYSTLKTERVEQNWTSSPLAPAPAITRESERTRELFREEKTESHLVPSQISPAVPQAVPPVVCHQCHHGTSTLSRSGTPMNKVTTTVKTYTYEVPADQDPTTVPIPELSEQRVEQHYLHSDTKTSTIPPSPALACQYCSHCNTRITSTNTSSRHLATSPPPLPPLTSTTLREHRVETTETDAVYPKPERMTYPKPANEIRTPVNLNDHPHNGHGPNGPSSYKWSETSYSAYNTTERHPVGGTTTTITNTTLHPAVAPFPRPLTPASNDQPPKKLDQLLAEFPDARFPTQPDGMTQRKVEASRETSAKKEEPKVSSKNVSGPAVYYPPGHQPFQKKEAGYQYAAASQGGGSYAAGRGMYEYESGSKSKEKSSERKAVVPLCLPLCCAMPCSIM